MILHLERNHSVKRRVCTRADPFSSCLTHVRLERKTTRIFFEVLTEVVIKTCYTLTLPWFKKIQFTKKRTFSSTSSNSKQN